MALLLECGILGMAFKEVQKRTVEMAQGLLQGNRGDLREPGVFGVLLELGKREAGVLVGQALLLIVERIRLLAQRPVVDEAATAKGPSKNLLLLMSGRDSVFVGSLLFHVYMLAYRGVNFKQWIPMGDTQPPLPPSKEWHSHPIP